MMRLQRNPQSLSARLVARVVTASVVVAASTFGLLSTPREARANGRFPAANQLVAAPGDPSTLTLRTTFGVLLSRDAAGTFDWICERAVGYGGVEDPSLAMTSATSIVAGTFEGVTVSANGGCGWTFIGGPLEKQVIVDIRFSASRASGPRSTHALPNQVGSF